MRILNWVLAGVSIGVIVSAFRDFERGRWLAPALPDGAGVADGMEPVLGYDGMDQETILDWLPFADLDPEQLDEIARYEEANLCREPVLNTLEEMLA